MAEVQVIKSQKINNGLNVGQYWRHILLDEVYILMEFKLYNRESNETLYALCGLSHGYPYHHLDSDINKVFSDDEGDFELLEGCSLNIKVD